MGVPTQIAEAAGINALADSASNAANKMEQMLDTLAAEFQPDSSIFAVPEVSSDIDDFLGAPAYSMSNAYAQIDSQIALLNEVYNEYSGTGLNIGEAPAAPVISVDAEIDIPTAPALTATMPTVVIPTAPTLVLPSTPTAPVVTDITVPNAPVLSIPSIPELATINTPSISTITVPVFEKIFPEYPSDLTGNITAFAYTEEEYTSEELVALRVLLLDDLNNGGYGVNHVDEEALFDREVDRNTSAGVAKEEEVIQSMASRGFDIPTGALVAALRRGQQDTLNAIVEANRNVSVTRADLIRKYRESSIQNSLTLNQTMVTHFGFVKQRMLEAAKTVVDFALRTVNLQAELYNLRVQSFTAYANAYHTRVQAQLAQLEAEKLQLEGEALKATINQQVINVYRARVDSLRTEIEIFNIEMQSVKVRAEIERDKVGVYATRMDAYRTEIQAQLAVLQGFQMQVDGERAKVQLYATQVEAHTSEVQAAKLRSDIQVQKASINLDTQRVKLASYQSQIAAYQALLSAEETDGRLQLSELDGKARVAVASADMSKARGDITIRSVEQANDFKIKRAELDIELQKARTTIATAIVELKTSALVEPAEMFMKFYEALGSYSSSIDVEVK